MGDLTEAFCKSGPLQEVDVFFLLKVDCTGNRDPHSRSGITGYPTLKILEDGGTGSYLGRRTAV